MISLKNSKNILINLDDATERLKRTTNLLSSQGISFTRFSGVKHPVGVIGCGLSHYHLLGIFHAPVVILEDDIEITEDFNTELDIPDETDAVYLGVSNHGYVRGDNIGRKGVVLASQYNEDYKRVYNMCATHAILYVSDKYTKAVRASIKSSLETGLEFDLGLASIHKDYTILTPNEPFFYQREQEEFTNFSLQV